MNRCLCLILMKSCLVLSSATYSRKYEILGSATQIYNLRAVQDHPAEGETVTGSNMSNYSTLPPKAELIISTKPSVNAGFTTSKSTGVPPSVPTAGSRFHAGSFVGGMTLAFIITLAVTLVYRLACSQQEVRYRAIEEHDAVI